MNKKALIILADGFEEIEAVCVIDILRRALIHTTVCGMDKIIITGSHNIKIQADKILSEFNQDFDVLILPGGSAGANNLAKSKLVSQFIKKAHHDNKIIAAICASPAVVLAPLGILNLKKATCYPGMENSFPATTEFRKDSVVVDDELITSRGPATAIEFALKIAGQLTNENMAEDLRKKLLA
ncbi:MAG: DJ-1 family glyoxalase III [Candidatus Omnitrophota bacterium]